MAPLDRGYDRTGAPTVGADGAPVLLRPTTAAVQAAIEEKAAELHPERLTADTSGAAGAGA